MLPHRPPVSRLPWWVKSGYGIGQGAEGVKNAGFNFVLFFFYTQVLGVGASHAGLALLIATVLDAISDPAVGFVSDRWSSAIGRRHPFLYAAAVPMSVCFVLLFSPPAGLGPTGLWMWLLTFAILVRITMTVYHVPYMALGADLCDDYHERTTLVAYRAAFGSLGLAVTLVLSWTVFFRATPAHADGQLNAAAYAPYGYFSGALILTTMLVGALATHARVRDVVRTTVQWSQITGVALVAAYRGVFANHSFRALFLGLLVFNAMRGLQEVLTVHMLTYFWRLTSPQIAALLLVALLSLVAGVPIWVWLMRLMDKRPALVGGIALFSASVVVPPTAKMLGVFPAEGTALYMTVLLAGAALSGFGGAAALVAAGSMVADIADEHDLRTGARDTGLFFGALLFATKATSGLGSFLGGIGLDVIAFPAQAVPADVSAGHIRALGILYGPATTILAVASIALLRQYRITGATHSRTAALLAGRNTTSSVR